MLQVITTSLGERGLLLRKRAEVGLLSGRNIKIFPSDSSQNFGVQIVVLNGGAAYVSGVQISAAGLSV